MGKRSVNFRRRGKPGDFEATLQWVHKGKPMNEKIPPTPRERFIAWAANASKQWGGLSSREREIACDAWIVALGLTQYYESPDQWYEREKAAFIAWWESEGQQKFGETPTLAAGAGWLARADAASPATGDISK